MQEVSDAEVDHKGRLTASSKARSAMARVVEQQAAIAQIGQAALGSASLEDLFGEACALVGRVLEAELVSVLELAADGGTLKVIAGNGWRPGIVGELVIGAANDSQSGYTIASGGPVIVADLATEERFKIPPSLPEHGAVSGMSVRIGDAERPYGVLAAFTERRGSYSRDDANFLQAVANVLATAIHRQSAEAELRASRDQLAAIVSTIDEGITVIDRKGLIFANDAAAVLTGYASAESCSMRQGRSWPGSICLTPMAGQCP